jgi:eukaryotic translation initiation factor 2C
MSKIPARVYDPPALAYKDQNPKNTTLVKMEIRKPGGKWDMLRDGPQGTKLSFVDNKHLEKWAILDLAGTSQNDINFFVDTLFKEGEKIGYIVDFQKETVQADMNNMNQVFQAFQKLCLSGLQMILVISRGKNAGIYNGLKHEGDVVVKISTQFVQQKNIGNQRFPPKPATMHNILLKINSKLGGTNQILHSSISPKIFTKPVMIMGADVTHPASDFKGTKQSIAAVVGSMDPKASQYKCEIRFQVLLIFTLFELKDDHIIF